MCLEKKYDSGKIPQRHCRYFSRTVRLSVGSLTPSDLAAYRKTDLLDAIAGSEGRVLEKFKKEK